jgi:hypothetical protein
VDERLLHQAIRDTTVTYAIPYVFGMLLLFAAHCLGGSLLATDWLRILLAVVGVGSAISAIALVVCALRYVRAMPSSIERHGPRHATIREAVATCLHDGLILKSGQLLADALQRQCRRELTSLGVVQCHAPMSAT